MLKPTGRGRTIVLATLMLSVAVLPSLGSNSAQRVVDRPFRVTAVTLEATPSKHNGPCPVSIKFSATITVNGSGTVSYTFLRSDGATAPVSVISFGAAETKSVAITWTLGSPSLPTYAGWQQIKVVSPNVIESRKAAFELRCTEYEKP